MPPRSRNSHLLDQVQPGDEIEVWWPHDAQYYSGFVGAKLASGRHRIFYNDGETEDLRLSDEQWRFVGNAADRILSSHSAPSLDPPSDAPQPHQPDSQPDPTSVDVQPTPPAKSQTTTTGKKRGRPRGRKSFKKFVKPKPTRAPRAPTSAATNETQTENKPDSAKPVAASQPTTSTKTKATAVKKRQRSSSTPAQDAKPKPKPKSKPAKTPATAADAPSLDADNGLIDAAPLAPKPSKQPSSSPAAPSSASTTPAPALASPSVVIPVQTNHRQKKLAVVSKPSHAPTWIAPAPSVVINGTSKGIAPAIILTRTVVLPGKTPAKISVATTPQAIPAQASSAPRPDSVNSQTETTRRLAVIQKAPEPSDPSQSHSKKAGISTSVQRKAVPIAPAASVVLTNHQTLVMVAGVSPQASTVEPTANSKPQSGKEAPPIAPAPLKHSPPKTTGKPDAMKGVEMASATSQQKTFILAANGTVREKPSQPSPELPTPGKEKQGNRNQAKQVKPQPARRESESSKIAVSPKNTKVASQSKMSLATIVSGHQEHKNASITCSDGQPLDPPTVNSKPQDTANQATSGLKNRDSVLQAGQKGSAKSKAAKVSKPPGVKKTIAKTVKTVSLKRFVTHPLPDMKGGGTPMNPKDGSDIIADVTVPRRSKSGVTSPLLGSPSHIRSSVSSPRKPLPTTSGTGSTAKTGSDPKKIALDPASPQKASSVDLGTQDKGERPGSKLGPFQPTRRRLKSLPGGVAHQGQEKSAAKSAQQKLPQRAAVSDREQPRRLSEPQRINKQREQVVASEAQRTKSHRSDETPRKAPQHSPTPGSKDLQVPQASAPVRGAVNESITKAHPASLVEQGRAQPQPQQPSNSDDVDKARRKQALPPGDTPISDPSSKMEVDESIKTGVKRAAPETLKTGKRRRPNPLKATASNATVNVTGSETVKGKTTANSTNDGGLEIQKKTSLSPAADVANIAAPKVQSPRTQAADKESTSTATFTASQLVSTRDGSGKDIQVRSSGNGSVPSKIPVKAPLRKKDQPSKNLAAKTPALAASKEPQQPEVAENREGPQDSEPAVASAPKSFARVRQRSSAGPGRPSNNSRGIINIPKETSEMSASSAIDAIKQAVREANMESLQPQLAPVVTRIEKCFADSDRRVRSLQGQLDRSTKALESLQKQLQDLRKTISYVPSVSEVRSLLDSQALEMKRAAAMSIESVVSAVKEDMKNYFPREIKTGMENVAALVQKDSVMMISKAVDSAVASGLLQGVTRTSGPNGANGQQNTMPALNQDVANGASLRGTVPGSAEGHSNRDRERRESNVEASRPTTPSRSTGTDLGTSGRECKRDDPSGDVAKESTRAPTNVPERQPIVPSNGPTTSGFERNKRLARPNGNNRSVENQETSERPGASQGEGAIVVSHQNAQSQSVLPSPNGPHPDSSARIESTPNDTPASGRQGSSVRSNGLSVVAKSSTVPRLSQPEAPLAKRENYAHVSRRMKVLLARSAVEWFLKGGCRDFAPRNERTARVSEEWVKDSVKRSLTGLLERLQQEEECKSAMITLAHSVGLQIQADWLLKGPTTANIDIARKNYEEWDPQLFDFEWESEKRVLAKLSEALLGSEKILMAAGELLEDPLRSAIRCIEHASKQLSS